MSASVTLDQMLRHMAWANACLFERLATLPESALAYTAPGSEWSVGAIAHHLVSAAENYAQRLHGEPRTGERALPTSTADVSALATGLAAADARLRAGAQLPGDEVLRWVSFNGETVTFPRWVLIDQAVHHATEHRAQIAGSLAAHGITAINLDAIDVWSLYDLDAGVSS